MSVDSKKPEIRFKGFSGEWEKYPLTTFISTLDAGVSVNSGDRPANENEFGILKTSCVTNGFFEPNENKVVFKTEEISRLEEPVLENTIIISRMNTPALVGANAYISKSYANYFLPDRLWAAKPSSIGDLKFIAYILGSDKGRRALSDLATGTSGSMKNISKPAVLELEFRTPEEKEQIQIGSYFQKLDTLINQHQQKHDKLSNIKEAMLEKMFPKQGETIPEIRFKGFSGKWDEINLLDSIERIIDFRGRTPKKLGLDWSPAGYRALSALNVKQGYIDFSIDPHFGDQELYDKWMSGSELHQGQVLFTTEAPMGNVAQVPNTDKYILSQRTIAFITKSEIIAEDFLAVLLRSPKVFRELSALSSGGTAKGVSQKTLANLNVSIPTDLVEQAAIGNYFQKLDALINQHQQQITKLNNIKQACLSKMFV